MVSGYDIAIKLYQHHVIERVTHTVDVINVRTRFILYLLYCYFSYWPSIVQLFYHISDILISDL